MIKRSLWLDRIEQAWSRRSIVWLSGVRRAGKTTLARMLPSALRALEDPELFRGGWLVTGGPET